MMATMPYHLVAMLFFSFSLGTDAAVESYSTGYQNVPSEPLLRFPFVDFLASPCDASLRVASGYRAALVGTLPPSLRPFAVHLLPLRSAGNESALNVLRQLRNTVLENDFPNNTDEEQASMVQELHLDVVQARQMARLIYPPSNFYLCDNPRQQLQAISQESPVTSSVIELYRGLMIASGYLHLMTKDAFDSSRYCSREDLNSLRTIHQLAGKLESMMCLILKLENHPSGRLGDIYPVVDNLLVTTVFPRYFDCSAKRSRTCLVVRYISRILNSVQILFNRK